MALAAVRPATASGHGGRLRVRARRGAGVSARSSPAGRSRPPGTRGDRAPATHRSALEAAVAPQAPSGRPSIDRPRPAPSVAHALTTVRSGPHLPPPFRPPARRWRRMDTDAATGRPTRRAEDEPDGEEEEQAEGRRGWGVEARPYEASGMAVVLGPSKRARTLEPESPLAQRFRAYRRQLDDMHERRERLVRYSRDVTISSKRAIFALHRATEAAARDAAVAEAAALLDGADTGALKGIAEELRSASGPNGPAGALLTGRGCVRALGDAAAVSPGLQEYAEARAFMVYVSRGEVASHEAVQSTMPLPLPVEDYLLGIADFTGELMRWCIAQTTMAPDADTSRAALMHMRAIYLAFQQLPPRCLPRIGGKMAAMQSSLAKIENSCAPIGAARVLVAPVRT